MSLPEIEPNLKAFILRQPCYKDKPEREAIVDFYRRSLVMLEGRIDYFEKHPLTDNEEPDPLIPDYPHFLTIYNAYSEVPWVVKSCYQRHLSPK